MPSLLLSIHYKLNGARYSEIRGGQKAAWRKASWLSRFSRPEPAEGWLVKCFEPGNGHKGGSAVFLTDPTDGTHGKLGWLDAKLYASIESLREKGLHVELRLRGLSNLEVRVHGEIDDYPLADVALRQFVSGNKRSFLQAELNNVLRRNPDRLRESLSDGCGICLSSDWSASPLKQESACITPCLHVFHTSCIIAAFKHEYHNRRCPTCRQSVNMYDLSSFAVPAEHDVSESVVLSPPAKRPRDSLYSLELRSHLWTDAEIEALKQLHAEDGNKWKQICQRFDFRGKTPLQLKDKMRNLLVPSFNDCDPIRIIRRKYE